MSAETTISVAYLGIGYGREHFALCVADHAAALGHSSDSIDLAQFLSGPETWALETGYQATSRFPRIYRRVRRRMDADEKGPRTVQLETLNDRFPQGSHILSVSGFTARILSQGSSRYIMQMVGDRAVSHSDVSRSVRRIAVASSDIYNMNLTEGMDVVVIGGAAQPVGLLTMDRDEHRRQMEFDAQPLVLFSDNGSGDMGKIPEVVRSLAPIVKAQRIRLALFIGDHSNEYEQIRREASRVDVPTHYISTPIDAPSGVIYVYGEEREAAIPLRMGLMPYAHVIIPASPMELVNAPIPCVVFLSTARNDMEAANYTHATSRGWAIDGEGDLGNSVEKLFIPDMSGVTPAQLMSDNAYNYNNPEAGRLLIESFLEFSARE